MPTLGFSDAARQQSRALHMGGLGWVPSMHLQRGRLYLPHAAHQANRLTDRTMTRMIGEDARCLVIGSRQGRTSRRFSSDQHVALWISPFSRAVSGIRGPSDVFLIACHVSMPDRIGRGRNPKKSGTCISAGCTCELAFRLGRRIRSRLQPQVASAGSP